LDGRRGGRGPGDRTLNGDLAAEAQVREAELVLTDMSADESMLDDRGAYEDIHALCERRDRSTVDAFLAHFARGLGAGQVDYPYAELAKPPGINLGSIDAAIAFLLEDPSRAYALHWSGRRSVSLHFLSDGSLIAAAGRDLSNNLAPQIREFVDYLDARWVVAEGATPPVESASQFRRVASKRRWAIVDGVEMWHAPESA
jgi:hypothetical protein